MIMDIAILANIEAESTSNSDRNLASNVHLLVQEGVDSGSLHVVDDAILGNHNLQTLIQGD